MDSLEVHAPVTKIISSVTCTGRVFSVSRISRLLIREASAAISEPVYVDRLLHSGRRFEAAIGSKPQD